VSSSYLRPSNTN